MVEIDCRIIPRLLGKCQLNGISSKWRVIKGTTGEDFYITKEVEPEEVRDRLATLKLTGVNSIAIVLAHSYAFPDHERLVGEIAKEIGLFLTRPLSFLYY